MLLKASWFCWQEYEHLLWGKKKFHANYTVKEEKGCSSWETSDISCNCAMSQHVLIFLIIYGNVVRVTGSSVHLTYHYFIFVCVCDFMASTFLFLNEHTVNCSPWKADWNQHSRSFRKQFPPSEECKSDGTPCSWKFAHQSKQTWKPLLIAEFTRPCSIFS